MATGGFFFPPSIESGACCDVCVNVIHSVQLFSVTSNIPSQALSECRGEDTDDVNRDADDNQEIFLTSHSKSLQMSTGPRKLRALIFKV